MRCKTLHRPVVAATDGSPAAMRGVRYAALEAEELGVGLELVHVVPGYVPQGPLPMLPSGSLQAFGRAVLERSVEAARAVVSGVEIKSSLVTGPRVSSLVEASAHAQLLVIGSMSLTLAERVWTGATAAGVCARTVCPVVVVPHDWAPGEPGVRSRGLVGFKSADRAAELLAGAFAWASSRDADIVLMHGWKLPSAYDGMVTSGADTGSFRAEQESVIEHELVSFRLAYPHVHVDIDVVHGQPADILVQATRGADRVFIARPVHGGYFHHLGPVARSVLRESYCPVEVVPPAEPTSDTAGLVLESAGFFQK